MKKDKSNIRIFGLQGMVVFMGNSEYNKKYVFNKQEII